MEALADEAGVKVGAPDHVATCVWLTEAELLIQLPVARGEPVGAREGELAALVAAGVLLGAAEAADVSVGPMEAVGAMVVEPAALKLPKPDAVPQLSVGAGEPVIPETVATPEVVGATEAEGGTVAEAAGLELPRPDAEPQLPVGAGVSVGPTEGDTGPEIVKDATALSLAAAVLLIAGLSDPTVDTVAEGIPLVVATPLELADTETEPVPVELLVGAALALCEAVPIGLADPVGLTRDEAELVVESVPLFETDTEPEAVGQAVPLLETVADFVPVTDTVPVFVAATLRVEVLLTVLLAEAERQALAEPVAELAPEPVTETEGEIVGSIVCVEEGAAEAELLGEAWAEKDSTEAVGLKVPLTLFVRDTDGVSVCVHVRKSVEVDVAEAGTDPVTDPDTVLLPTTLLLGDTEAVLVLDTELLLETVRLPPLLRVAARDPLEVAVVDEVLDLADEADKVTDTLRVFDGGPVRVFVVDTVDVLLPIELVVGRVDTVRPGDCVLGVEPLGEIVLEPTADLENLVDPDEDTEPVNDVVAVTRPEKLVVVLGRTLTVGVRLPTELLE
jgi:hypothetical protein